MGRWVGLGVAWLLFACSNGAKETSGPTDAGKTSDAGPSADAAATGDAGPRPADAGNDAGITVAAACGHYFDVVYGGKCQYPSIAADELARIRPRYVRWCESDRSRPGLSDTAERLDACASALASDECDGTPVVCDAVVGTLPAGAMVNGRDQCQSNQAFANATSADAGLMLPDCGTCSAVIPIGQSCADANAGACAQGSLCSRQDPKICVAFTQGDIGASCGASQTDLCKLGLICGGDKKCTTRGTAGAACSASNPCELGLQCDVESGTTGICQSGAQAGAPCSILHDCARGLGCSGAGSCVPITWAKPGEPCNLLATCLSGVIDYCPFTQNTLAGTCPAVIPDGSPCNLNDPTQTCDTFAGCWNGTCSLPDVFCK